MLPPGQPQVGDLIPASCLQLAAGAHVGHEAVQPHTQQCTWMVGRRSQWFSIRLHTQFCPVLPVQRITNSATNRAGWSRGTSSSRVGGNSQACSRFISRRGICYPPTPRSSRHSTPWAIIRTYETDTLSLRRLHPTSSTPR